MGERNLLFLTLGRYGIGVREHGGGFYFTSFDIKYGLENMAVPYNGAHI
jgi:hypothetical protein